MTTDQLEQTSALAETWEPEEVLRWAFSTYQQDAAIASAFGAEGVVLIDMAARVSAKISIFTLDTQFLFPETYELAARIEQRYKLKIDWIHSALTPEQQAAIHEPALWQRDPDQCCTIRKIEPLARKLAGLKAWITAIRRDQTPARANARKVEWDHRFGLVKINPIAAWTSDRVWEYIRKNQLLYNPLHDRGYPSIGCLHCTRPVTPDENPRAGRWSWLQKAECGLHQLLHEPSPRLTQLPTLPVSLQSKSATSSD